LLSREGKKGNKIRGTKKKEDDERTFYSERKHPGPLAKGKKRKRSKRKGGGPGSCIHKTYSSQEKNWGNQKKVPPAKKGACRGD